MRLPSLLAFAFLTGSLAAQTPPTTGETEAWVAANLDTVLARHTFTAANGLVLPYRLHVPAAAGPGKKYPLLVWLHGRGQRGTDNSPKVFSGSGLFKGARSIVSPAMQAEFPCFVLVPQCSDKTVNEEWAKWVGNTPETPFVGLGKDGSYTQAPEPSDSGRAVLELIDSLLAGGQVDAARVYLTGQSMGGFGTWEFAMRRPELFAAIAPMAGYSDPAKAGRIAGIPCWIFHGDADETNPVQGSRTMYDLLKKAGADVRYTEYPGAGHGESFRRAYQEPGLLPWIFAQRKP